MLFTNAGGDRAAGVQGWGCTNGDLSVGFTGEEATLPADFDFDWIVDRGR